MLCACPPDARPAAEYKTIGETNAMNEIRLIAMDLDGTMLNPQGEVSEKTREALTLAREKGIVTAACSGRYCENVSMLFLDSGLYGPVIGSNGAQTMDRPLGSMIFRHYIPADTARQIRETLDSLGADYYIFAQDRVVSSRKDMLHHSQIAMGDRIVAQSSVRFTLGPEAVDEAVERGIFKFFIRNNGELEEIRQELAAIPGACVTRSTPWNLEMMAEGVDKGLGLSELCGYLGIPLSQAMAFGDQENDLPMLLKAGMGVAMGNADAAVLERAKYRTLSNAEDGVAAMIRQVIG